MPNLDPADYPDPFFIFVDHASPTTWHNFNLTGRFCAALAAGTPDDFLMFVPNPRFAGFISPFLNNITIDYRVEWDAEQARRFHAPDAPSRLSAVYAFGSYADCQTASQKHQWSLAEVERFRAVPDPGLRIRKVNMEIVSVMRTSYRLGTWAPDVLDTIWSAYWNGTGDVTVEVPVPPPTLRQEVPSGCIWEYLIDGCVERI